MEQTKEEKLDEIRECINKEDSLYAIHRSEAENFEKESRAEGQGTIQIMTYGDYIIYLKAEDSKLPHIPLAKFNYTSGTFEKNGGQITKLLY